MRDPRPTRGHTRDVAASGSISIAPGELLAHVGALVIADAPRELARGVRVTVCGTAITRGLLEVTRARARPWSARLAPWQACGWEHALVPDHHGELTTVLREAAPPMAIARADTPRRLLALAVWVELQGRAVKPGRGTLRLEVAPEHAGFASVCVEQAVRVRSREVLQSVSAYVAWEGTLAERVEAAHGLLDRVAARLACTGRAPRALGVRGTAHGTLHVRAGCAVVGEHGLASDARLEALWQAAVDGRIERLLFAAPACASTALDVALSQGPRFRDRPVELVVSLDRRAVGPALPAVRDALAELVACASPVVAFACEHPFAPAIAELTPWERAQGIAPARTLAQLRVVPRVDPDQTFAYVGPR